MQMRTPALEITVIFRSLTRHAMAKLATLTHGQLGRRWRRHVDDDDGNLVTLMRWPSPGMVHAGYWTHESKGVTGWQSVSYRRLLGQLTVVKFSSAEKAKGTAGMLVSAITNFAVSLFLLRDSRRDARTGTAYLIAPEETSLTDSDSVASVSQSRPFRNLVLRGALIMHRKFKIPLENPLYHSRHVSRVTAGGATGSVLPTCRASSCAQIKVEDQCSDLSMQGGLFFFAESLA